MHDHPSESVPRRSVTMERLLDGRASWPEQRWAANEIERLHAVNSRLMDEREIIPISGVRWCVVHEGVDDELDDAHGPDDSWCAGRRNHELEHVDCDIRPLFYGLAAS